MNKKGSSSISKTKLVQLQKQFGTDGAVAEAVGVSPKTIYNWRKKWGIPAALGQETPMAKSAAKAQPESGKAAKANSAAKAQPKTEKVTKSKLVTKAQLFKLQKEFKTDFAIAKSLGVSQKTIGNWRKKLGVSAPESSKGRAGKVIKSKAQLVKLQKELRTDAAIGETLGISRVAVGNWRRKLGVPALENRGGKPQSKGRPKAKKK